MKVGVVVPQGHLNELAGWEPRRAWRRATEIAHQAEALGFESIWLFDHFTTAPTSADEITFEAFTALAALAALTSRVRLGHVVLCTAYRNPALTAKMAATLDVISGGRMELGLGAGWKQDEWEAYGYGPLPGTRDRLARLADDLEIVTRMLAPGRSAHATYEGRYSQVIDAINVPKPIQQPRVPIIVGGSGPNVTWRLAARFADELNVGGPSPDELAEALPVIRSRCEEIGRDPATLRISINIDAHDSRPEGAERVALLARYRALGVSRVMTLLLDSLERDDALVSFARDASEAGAELA